jgi:plastocyanin
MDRRILAMVGGIALVISACSSSGGGGSSAAASAAGAPSAAASAAGAACAEASGNGTVAVSVKDFSFEPSTINAKVGDTITFSNTGNAPHNATLDTGGCATPTISPGKSDGLTFTAPGSYPFHCSIHPQMKGTITVGA